MLINNASVSCFLTHCTLRPHAIILDKQWHSLTPPHTFKVRQNYRSWQWDERERGRLASCRSVDCWGEGQLKDGSSDSL